MTMMTDENPFNSYSLENLLSVLSKVYTSPNLLVLDRELSPLINHLTSFSQLKEAGKFQNLIWLQDIKEQPKSIFQEFGGLIILAAESNENLAHIHQVVDHANLKATLIVKNLTKSYIYQLNHKLGGKIDFDTLVNSTCAATRAISSKIKVVGWKTFPIYDSNILVTNHENVQGIQDYFDQPLKQVNELCQSLIEVLFESSSPTDTPFKYKLKNIYGKGDHASLLINQLKDYKIPEYLNSHLNSLEQQFYRDRFESNTDLVVLERNLDYSSVAFNQLTYHGLIDDLFGLQFSQISGLDDTWGGAKAPPKNLKNDLLYTNTLQHLNFSSSGLKLSMLAKQIQHQFKSNEARSEDINAMKKVVSSLGDLTHKHELIKKHTNISEQILAKINAEYQHFLNFQNDLFDTDYKAHLASLKQFINANYPDKIVFVSVVLVSIVNNGIKERDYDWILQDTMDLYGLETALVLEKLVQLEVVSVIAETQGDLLTTLGLTSVHQASNPHHTVGVSGAPHAYSSNYTLIDKYWNLHPQDERENHVSGNESISLVESYQNPSFTLPSNTVPLLYRLVEALYFRDFLKYKPTNNLKKRPNWDNLALDMFHGETVDINLGDTSDTRDKRSVTSTSPQYVVVVVIGGLTRSEISCFQYLQQKFEKNNCNRHLIVLTSSVVNSNSLLQAVSSI